MLKGKPMTPHISSDPVCPDCRMDRRTFLKQTAVGLAVGTGAMGGWVPKLQAKPTAASPSETLAAALFKSLSEEQRNAVVFPFDHPLRSKVDNNWHITDKRVDEFFTPDQQAMIRELFTKMHSPEYADRVMHQVEHDNGKRGFGANSIALFGEPGTGKFEFVLTGRHCTRRCDGDSVEGTAFGGPIFYGHAAQGFNEKPDHPGNVYWYQALRANEVFAMLDGKQRKMALLGDARDERATNTVRLTGKTSGLPGIPMTELSGDQKNEVRKVLAALLAPFRKEDSDEAMKLIEANGFDYLHMSFYKNHDIGNDGVWDVWQIEGPSMLWYFRGAPHVHTWVHIRNEAEIV